MKRIISSGVMLVALLALVAGGTGAFFSDTETSTGNVFAAGAIDIAITDIAHTPSEPNLVGFTENTNGWSFSFSDLKPLDKGTVTYTLSNQDNEAYVCAMVEEKSNNDNNINDPETTAGDVTPGLGGGELGQFLNFKFGTQSGSLAAISGVWQTVGTIPSPGILPTAIDYCFGTFSGSNCVAGAGNDNLAQTDSLTADVKFYAVQTRNNPNFSCASLNEEAPSVTETYSTGFEPNTFVVGNINGQGGWKKTGSFDSAVVNNPVISDTQSLRISNAVTSGSFGDQTFTPELVAGTGETGVASDKHFEAEFKISSTQLAQQPGLAISVSPDNGEGARMSYLSFVDSATGIDVTFYDVTNAGPLPSVASFNPTSLGSLNRNISHTIKFVINFVDGPANDVVKIYIDNALVHTGTSWEDYFRFDPEQSGSGNVLSPVNSLIFRASGTAAPSTLGNGYLIDNVVLTSSAI